MNTHEPIFDDSMSVAAVDAALNDPAGHNLREIESVAAWLKKLSPSDVEQVANDMKWWGEAFETIGRALLKINEGRSPKSKVVYLERLG